MTATTTTTATIQAKVSRFESAVEGELTML
jgi:hypothetical protein